MENIEKKIAGNVQNCAMLFLFLASSFVGGAAQPLRILQVVCTTHNSTLVQIFLSNWLFMMGGTVA